MRIKVFLVKINKTNQVKKVLKDCLAFE